VVSWVNKKCYNKSIVVNLPCGTWFRFVGFIAVNHLIAPVEGHYTYAEFPLFDCFNMYGDRCPYEFIELFVAEISGESSMLNFQNPLTISCIELNYSASGFFQLITK